jgi:prepilin-type N-terminal cleavage/methylation domain-containing protein
MNNRSGVVLIEVMVALTIIAIAGVATIAWVGESLRTVARLEETEREMLAAIDAAEHTAGWSSDTIATRVGTTRLNGFVVRLDRATPRLYALTVLDSTQAREIVSTYLYVGNENATR